MIYDKIEGLQKYKGISKNLDRAIEFIENTDLNTLPDGRTEIDGSRVFVNVMEAEAKGEEDLGFEIHKKYMDIQIDLKGTEAVALSMEASVSADYREETDFGTVSAQKDVFCVLGEGRFIICMTGEPHMPGIAAADSRYLKKCVFKVEGGGSD